MNTEKTQAIAIDTRTNKEKYSSNPTIEGIRIEWKQ